MASDVSERAGCGGGRGEGRWTSGAERPRLQLRVDPSEWKEQRVEEDEKAEGEEQCAVAVGSGSQRMTTQPRRGRGLLDVARHGYADLQGGGGVDQRSGMMLGDRRAASTTLSAQASQHHSAAEEQHEYMAHVALDEARRAVSGMETERAARKASHGRRLRAVCLRHTRGVGGQRGRRLYLPSAAALDARCVPLVGRVAQQRRAWPAPPLQQPSLLTLAQRANVWGE